jgi:hypothetical protein
VIDYTLSDFEIQVKAMKSDASAWVCAARFVAVILCLCSNVRSAVAQERPPDMTVRKLQGNVLFSPDQPKVSLQVAKAFTALPVLEFPIRRDTWVERYIFVDSAADMTIRRLVIVQFEHAQVGSSFRFVYPPRPPMTFGSAVYRHGTFTANDEAEIAEHPQLEVGQTQRYLAGKGYKAGKWWHVARLARAADAAGKTEIIIFYQESFTVPPGSKPQGNPDDDLPGPLAETLFAHLKSAVKSD